MGNIVNRKMTKQQFVNQWLRHFASDISKADRKQYVDGQFIWHVFSWKLIPEGNYLTGEAARRAYNAKEKTDRVFCDRFGDGGVTDQLSDRTETAEKIDAGFSELYVAAKDWSWTYIKTHEGDVCGPYFYEIKK